MRITDRFVFYSADLGSIKNSSLKSLLLSHGQSDKPVADLLLETNGWWIDIFAPSNEEMRLLSQVILWSFLAMGILIMIVVLDLPNSSFDN